MIFLKIKVLVLCFRNGNIETRIEAEFQSVSHKRKVWPISQLSSKNSIGYIIMDNGTDPSVWNAPFSAEFVSLSAMFLPV